MRRRGFTLLELMIALVVGSTVVLLAYTTLRGGMDTEARVTRVRDEQETVTILRAMLSDGIRHAILGDASRESMGMRVATDLDGRAMRLHLTTRGIELPHGATDAWQLVLHADSTSLVLDAGPVSARDRQPLRLRVSALQGFGVRFLAPTETAWRDRWEDSTRLPSAVEVEFLDRQRRRIGAPLIVRTSALERL